MPSADVVSTFSARTLTKAVRTFDDASTDNFFTSLFRGEGRPIQAEGRKVSWKEKTFSRALAPVVGLVSPTPETPRIGLKDRDSFMMRTAETRRIPWDALFLDDTMGELKANAKAVIADELEDMTIELGKTREYACSQILQTGGLVVNTTNIPNSDVAFTLTYGLATYTKNAAWSTAGTKILSDEVPRIQAAMVASCGQPASRIIINDVTYRYLLGNTEVTAYGQNERWAENFLRAAVADMGAEVMRGIRIGDLLWKANAYGFKPAGGSFTRWMASDQAVILPEKLGDVFAYAQGKQAIPRQLWGPRGDAGIEEVSSGLVAYAKVTDDPVGVQLFVSDHFLPIVLWPEAVMIGTLV